MNSLKIGYFPRLDYAASEAINTLCTNLAFSGEAIRKIMITSSHASEGKSHLAMNTMRTLAKLGKSVVLVDTDMRRSMIELQFRLQYADPENKPGLAHLLAGRANSQDVIYQTNLPGAYMVPIGRNISNPLPLLNSKRLGSLLDMLAIQKAQGPHAHNGGVLDLHKNLLALSLGKRPAGKRRRLFLLYHIPGRGRREKQGENTRRRKEFVGKSACQGKKEEL